MSAIAKQQRFKTKQHIENILNAVCGILCAIAVTALYPSSHRKACWERSSIATGSVSQPLLPSWFVELQPTESLDAHADQFGRATLNESDFKNRYFHGQVRRFALDTSD